LSALFSYAQAMQSVGRAIEAFEEQGFVWRRPDDFFAEMLKSDEHMQKVSSPSLLVAP
jgi:rRNA-processing protein EBP2